MRSRYLIILILSITLLQPLLALGDEYDFEIPEAEKKSWEFGGKLETRFVHHQLDQDSTIYKLKYQGEDKDVLNEWRPLLELKAGYDFGLGRFFMATHHEYHKTTFDEEWVNRVYEGYFLFNPHPGFTVEAGKKAFLWGKGYAWNPVGFINRPKDPDDPELNLEGYTALSLDIIKSFSDKPIQTIAFTPVLIPVFDWENAEMGESGDVNYAAKLYTLFYDTDIDLIYFGGTNQSDSIGLDFSRNLKENLEIHGEFAFRADVEKKILESDGNVKTRTENQSSWLLGLRYLNRYDTTFIFEYYHNGAGYQADEIDDFFTFQSAAYSRYLSTGRLSPLKKAARKANPYYSQRNYGQDYLYLKIQQKEPLGIVDFTPWITSIFNLHDGSFSLTPGLTYQLFNDMELSFKSNIPFGPSGTEYGEKQDRFKAEFLVRYYF